MIMNDRQQVGYESEFASYQFIMFHIVWVKLRPTAEAAKF